MENKLEIPEPKCPKCGSLDLQFMGAGHVSGVGQPHKDINRFQHQCASCQTPVWLPKPNK